MRIAIVKLQVLIILLALVSVARGETDTGDGGTSVFIISLLDPAKFIPVEEDDPIAALEDLFAESLLQANGYSSVEVIKQEEYELLSEFLASGVPHVVEADLGVVYSGELNQENSGGYEVAFQTVPSVTNEVFAAVVVRKDSDVKSLGDISGRSAAAVHPSSFAGGIAQEMAVNGSGLHSGEDYDLYYAGSSENALKMLVSE